MTATITKPSTIGVTTPHISHMANAKDQSNTECGASCPHCNDQQNGTCKLAANHSGDHQCNTNDAHQWNSETIPGPHP